MPLNLLPTKAYSTASIGKAYLDAMHIRPPGLRPAPALGLSAEAVCGAAMQSYFGGRTGCGIRRGPVPVAYLDFLSEYPTVNALMGLWSYLTADSLEVVAATEDVVAFLESVTLDDCFKPETWTRLPALVQIQADGDILPVRGRWDFRELGWQIGVNPLTCSESLWYTLADCVASKLLTGKTPAVVRAMRFVPKGRQRLRRVKLRGEIAVDPMRQDFFRVVIEERARLRRRMDDLTGQERVEQQRLQGFLKILANSASYGILAEMNQMEQPGECNVWTGGPEPFPCSVRHPEELGRFCCPPLAAIITGAGRLLLAMLERCVTDLGGSYAMTDTDSMAVVSTERGGLIPCPGGRHRRNDGREAIRALSASEMDEVVRRFESLNPYDPTAVRGSVLKVEDENYALCGIASHDRDEHGHERQCVCTKTKRELWCYAISSKRYALDNLNSAGEPVLRKWSEHGLGHLLNPTDPDSEDRDWMRQVWNGLVREGHGLPTTEPRWLDAMSVSRITVSSWELYQQFKALAPTASYADRVKPGNFLLIAQADSYFTGGQERPIPVAPYETDQRRLRALPWLDRKTGKRINVTTDDRETCRPGVVRVRTYREVLELYRVHPEAKTLGPDGQVCGPRTDGLLQRRPLIAASVSHVGKETNRLEAVLTGEEDDYEEVYAEYEPPDRPIKVLRRVLRNLPRGRTARETGLSLDGLADIIEGRSEPSSAHLARLEAIARASLTADLAKLGTNVRGTGLLPLPALLAMRDATLADVQWALTSELETLVAHARLGRASEICGVPRTTLRRRLCDAGNCDADTLLVLRTAIEPYRETLAVLVALDEQASNLETEIAAMRESVAADPHAKYVKWLDRTHLRYDRGAWQRGRLVVVKNPVRRGQGGWYRVDTVDYSDILDREAQQLGENIDAFMRGLDRAWAATFTLAELEAQAGHLAVARNDPSSRLR